MKKYNRIMEYFWLTLTIASILFLLYLTIVDRIDKQSGLLWAIPVMTFIQYFFRRTMRIRQEKNNKQ